MNRYFPATLALAVALGSATAAPRMKTLELQEVLRVAGKIDDLLEKDLAVKKAKSLPAVSDEVFVRRSYVTIVGRIPTAQEATSFLDSKAPDKRTKLIEKLVKSPGYDSSAFNYFADLLRLQTTHEQYGLGWHVWLRNSLAKDKPWDTLVNEFAQLRDYEASISVAVNEEYSRMDVAIADGDEIAFLPPVSGG